MNRQWPGLRGRRLHGDLSAAGPGGMATRNIRYACMDRGGAKKIVTVRGVVRYIKYDGLVKIRKLDFLPQDVGYKIEKATMSCGQNKMLGLFASASELGRTHKSVKPAVQGWTLLFISVVLCARSA